MVEFYLEYALDSKKKNEGPFETRVGVLARVKQLQQLGMGAFEIVEMPALAEYFDGDTPGEDEEEE